MTHPITIFYLYAETDEALRQQLEKHLALLRWQGVIAGWEPILAGTQWEEKTEQAFNEAELILLLVSADFLDSCVCYKQQMQRALERQKHGEVQVIPILLRPVERRDATYAHLQMLPTNGRPVTQWTNQDAAWVHITERILYVLEGKPQPMVLANKEVATYTTEIHQHFHPPVYPYPTSIVVPVKPVWMIPYERNPFFTGREEVLSDLHKTFQRKQVQALSQPQEMSGLGGIGKTQIAVEYAYRYREKYQQVLWASAEKVELLTAAYAKIAAMLDLPEKNAQEQEVIVEAVKRWLEEQQGWVLILDNADEPEVLEPFLPPVVGGHVLITTRANDLTMLELGFGHTLEIETFTPKQGALFVLKRAGLLSTDAIFEQARTKDRQQAMQISRELGDLPLALEQAGAYIAKTRCTLVSYQQRYRANQRLGENEQCGKVCLDAVMMTWKLSFEQVKATNPAAAVLLQWCSFLAPDVISEWMLLQGIVRLGEKRKGWNWGSWPQRVWGRGGKGNSKGARSGLDQAVEVLRAYALLKRDPLAGGFSMHRCVQVALRDKMTEEEETAWKQWVVIFLKEVCPEVNKVEQWAMCEQWVPHALVSVSWLDQASLQTEEAARVCHEAGYYLSERGLYVLAEPLLKRALEINEQKLEPRHPSTIASMNNLAILYSEQRKYEEAEPLYKRVLAIREQSLGPTHPDTAESVNNLAEHYSEVGRYEEAEPLYRRALEINEQELGPTHLDMAESVNNLAALYYAQGKYEEAEPLYKRALAICEQELRPRHPDTAMSVNNLAVLYSAQGRYEEAEPLLVRALAIREQELGPGHPDTAMSMNNLAVLYSAQGRYVEAEPLLVRALMIREQELEPGHPDTATSVNNLAALYSAQGRYVEAEPLYEQALAICEQELGPGHPDTATSVNNLALLYSTQGRYSEAELLMRRALEILEQSLGIGHPTTRIGRRHYAGLLRAMGREGEAMEMEKE